MKFKINQPVYSYIWTTDKEPQIKFLKVFRITIDEDDTYYTCEDLNNNYRDETYTKEGLFETLEEAKLKLLKEAKDRLEAWKKQIDEMKDPSKDDQSPEETP